MKLWRNTGGAQQQEAPQEYIIYKQADGLKDLKEQLDAPLESSMEESIGGQVLWVATNFAWMQTYI